MLCRWQEPASFCLRMSSSVFRTISAPRLATAATAKSNTLRKPKRTKVRSLLLVSVLMLVAKRLVKKRERDRTVSGSNPPHQREIWILRYSKVEPACFQLFSPPLTDLKDSVQSPRLRPGYCAGAAC